MEVGKLKCSRLLPTKTHIKPPTPHKPPPAIATSMRRLRPPGKQSILGEGASINLQSDASKEPRRSGARKQQTGAKLIFSRRPQQDVKVVGGSGSSGSLPLAPQRLLGAVIVVGAAAALGLILVTTSSVLLGAKADTAAARSMERWMPPALASLPPLRIDARQLVEKLSSSLIQNLASLPPQPGPFGTRWIRPGAALFPLSSSHHQHRTNTLPPSDRAPPSQSPLLPRHPTRLVQALSRISRRIGARNSIRFHNAFRDFAWQVLASMSMPTPVIYELRRRQLYSPEEDQWNDSLASKNTSMTVRTRRQLGKDTGGSGRPQSELQLESRADEEEEDEEESDKGLRARLRLRLEDLVSLSRRSLFGRVIRLPALFPFKRHQQEDNGGIGSEVANATLKSVHQGAQGGALLQGLKLRGNRKKESSDHQKIFIDGKEYYINDGELKEVKH